LYFDLTKLPGTSGRVRNGHPHLSELHQGIFFTQEQGGCPQQTGAFSITHHKGQSDMTFPINFTLKEVSVARSTSPGFLGTFL
jgi:hypothetical protein